MTDIIDKVAEAIKADLIADPDTDAYMQADDSVDDFLIDGHVNLRKAATAALEALAEGLVWDKNDGEKLLLN